MLAFLLWLLAAPVARAQYGNTPVEIMLLGGFKGDRVKVLVDGKLLFNQIITTDESTGLADAFSLKRVAAKQKLSLLVNGVLLYSNWLDPAYPAFGFGFSKNGYFIDTQVFFKAPMFD